MTQEVKVGPIKCPQCGQWVLKPQGSHKFVLRNRVTLFDGETTVAICRNCKERVPIPVELVT